ncbi:hypothetical protein K492DRAFT_205860 [Lichtheimia hyalospora FSU 10163]|nr:hypothetical protein K492DRAFT_205860 [Lichtheimia hyalospora FSU 10163]
MLFRRCRQCQFKLVAITQDDVDMLLYCVHCQTTISDFQASYATEVTCFQNGLLVNYKVYDALAGILGCDASTYCELLAEHEELPEYIREEIHGLMCHLVVRAKSEGQELPVLDGIVPVDPESFVPILEGYLSNNEQRTTQSQQGQAYSDDDDDDDDIYYDAN